MAEVVILGAGLTGLSTAFHLEQLKIDYKIFEKNDRPGGLLQSEQHEGFTFDHTGHLLHISDDYFKNFLNGIADIKKNFDLIERKSAVYSHNTLTDYPFQINLHGLPSPIIAECIEAFVKRKKSIKQPANFHEWVLKYFGAGFGKHFFFPYNSKILSYDIKKIHPSWTGRFVPQTNLEAIIQGALQPATGIGYNSSFYYPKVGGIEFLIRSLASQLKTPITTNHRATHIDLQQKIITFADGKTERYSTLISTMPLDYLLKNLHEPSSTLLTRGASRLECNAVINYNLCFKKTIDLDKHWIYFPEKQHPFYRLGFWHNISARSVKTGHTAIYGEVSYLPGTKSPAQLQRLIDECKKKTLDFLGFSISDIVAEKNLHLDHAYVIYNQWRHQNLAKVISRLADYSIHSIGRFGEWKYSSMQEAILDGKKMAETILKTHQARILPAMIDRPIQSNQISPRLKNLV